MSNDSRVAMHARPEPKPAPSALPADPPTCSRRARHDDELDRRRTDVDFDEPVAGGARKEEGSWQKVHDQHRRRKNKKTTGTLLLCNGSFIGVERTFDFFLGGCAIQTSEIGVCVISGFNVVYRPNLRHSNRVLLISKRSG